MSQVFSRARDFILRNARLLDRQLFACLFEGGSRQAVIQALLAYRNPDGGFGNGLEPDVRCPDSQPIPQEVALQILAMIGAFDHPCVLQACDFLQSITTPEGGVPFALPAILKYPHSPWMSTVPTPPASINPTGSLAALLLAHGVQHPWLESAIPFCWRDIEISDTTEFHDLLPMIAFLQHAPDRQRARLEFERLRRRIVEKQLVCLDPKAAGYVHPPLDWAPTPQHWGRELFGDAVVQADLDRLLASQQPDGGWNITWPPLSPTVELEWRGWRTVQALAMLKAYGVEVN